MPLKDTRKKFKLLKKILSKFFLKGGTEKKIKIVLTKELLKKKILHNIFSKESTEIK